MKTEVFKKFGPIQIDDARINESGRLYGHFCLYKIFMWDTDNMCYVDCPHWGA